MNMDTDFSFFYLYTYLIIYKTMIFDREVTKSHTKKPRRNQEKGRRG